MTRRRSAARELGGFDTAEHDEFSALPQAPETRQVLPVGFASHSASLLQLRQVSALGPAAVQTGALEEQFASLVHCTQDPNRALSSLVSQTGVAPVHPVAWPSSVDVQGRQ
jgi:hypothetical protein